jgi:hypothetical protein
VHLVQLDMIGFETLEGTLYVAADFICRKAPPVIRPVVCVPHLTVDFGGKHDLFPPVPALGKPPAQDFFGPAAMAASSIHVGGIEKIDTRLQCPIHNRERFLLIRPGAEIHGSQTQAAYL